MLLGISLCLGCLYGCREYSAGIALSVSEDMVYAFVKEISGGAFWDCSSLEFITIPESAVQIANIFTLMVAVPLL